MGHTNHLLEKTSSKRISTSKCHVCNCLFWNFLGIFLEDFFGGIFWEKFFGWIFLGGILWRIFLRGILQKVFWIWKELICLSRFWFFVKILSKSRRKEEGQNLDRWKCDCKLIALKKRHKNKVRKCFATTISANSTKLRPLFKFPYIVRKVRKQ